MRRITYVLVISMMCLGLGILIGLLYGPASLTVTQLWEALMHSGEKSPEIIIWQLRMPRVAIALVVGASLATAGALLQISARNPQKQLPGNISAMSVLDVTSTRFIVRFQ